jgi:ParB family chromosome partitioning protein
MSDQITHIALSKLVPSPQNVRRTGSGDGLGELMASIQAHGLLQNLTVRPLQKENAKSADRYEVVAGGRRLAALIQLAKAKRIAKGFPVPCRVLENGDGAEASLAENIVRTPLHPSDQFDAFAALQRDGLGAEEIAARFGIAPAVVLQRLKLAAVSPKLIEAYRSGDMTLEQLMAFTISDDHEAQERVWFDYPLHEKHPQGIRRALTKTLVAGNDRRARFVGRVAYEAAGGAIVRDLFDSEDEGYFTDGALLERLTAEKLSLEAETVRAEGWAWVETLPEMDYMALGRMGRVQPVGEPLSDETQTKLDELTASYDGLIEEHGEDPPENIVGKLEELSAEIDALSERRLLWRDEDRARAGAIVTVSPQGHLQVERGLLKPEDRRSSPATASEAADLKSAIRTPIRFSRISPPIARRRSRNRSRRGRTSRSRRSSMLSPCGVFTEADTKPASMFSR